MAKREESTKFLFLKEALRLFGERGFDSVKISEISDAIGCTAPALYKHYKSKQDLYEAILEESYVGFRNAIDKMDGDFQNDEERKAYLINMSEEEMTDKLIEMFLYTIHDEWVVAFRKLMMIEQFHLKELAEMYDKRYVFSQYDQYTKLFTILQEAGRMKSGNPRNQAITFISPLTLMISVYDRDNTKEQWCIEILKNHFKEFYDNYFIR